MKEWSTLKKLIWLRKINGGGGSSDPLNTFTGAIVRFFSKKAKPIVKLEANFTPIQNLNGYDAPWPPGGGKNLFDVATAPLYPRYFTDSGYWRVASSNALSYAFPCEENTTYTVSCDNDEITIFRVAYIKYTNIPDTGDVTLYETTRKTEDGSITITTGVGAKHIVIQFNYALIAGGANLKIQVEKSSAASPWSPYSNICPISGHDGCDIFDKAEYDAQATPTATISFGQTVYGGTLTVNEDGSGQVVADRVTKEVTSSTTKNGTRTNSKGVFNANYLLSNVGDRSKTIICNSLGIYTATNIYNGGDPLTVGLSSDSKSLYVMSTTSISSVSAFDDWLDSIGTIQVCYYLATPITIPVTAQQIQTLVGENNVWVDSATGDITVQAYGTEIT